MRRLKIISLIGIMLVCVTLSACQQEPAPTPRPSRLVITEEEVDLGGKEIKYFYQGAQQPHNNQLASAYSAALQTAENKKMVEHIRAVEKEFNCRIVIYQGSKEDIVSAAMSGKAAADIGEFTESDVLHSISLQNNGYMALLDPYEEYLEFNNSEIWDLGMMEHFRFGTEKTHVLCRNTVNKRGANIFGLRFNKTMLKDYHLWEQFNLYEMQSERTWTWDAFSRLSRMITRDSDGNGQTDLFAINYTSQLLDALSVSNMSDLGSVLIDTDEKYNVIFKANEPEFKDAFDLLSVLSNSGCLFFDPYEETDAYGDFKQGKYLFNLTTGRYMYDADRYPFEYGLVTMPLGPNNRFKDNYGFLQPMDMVEQLALIKHAPDPVSLVKVLKALASPPFTYDEMKSMEKVLLTEEYHYDEDMFRTNDLMNVNDMVSYDMKTGIFYGVTDSFYDKIQQSLMGHYSAEKVFGEDAEAMAQEVTQRWAPYKQGLQAIGE